MPIEISQLKKIYETDQDSKSESWIAVPDSVEGTIHSNVLGSSGGNTQNGWKIHISIDPDKIAEAALLVAEALNKEGAPRASIKFANQLLAKNGQPSKQIALTFYAEELKSPEKISTFLEDIQALLSSKNIDIDKRPINSDREACKTKFDAPILDSHGKPTRFNYRNDQCIVMEDKTYQEWGGQGNVHKPDPNEEQTWIRQSYYLQLKDTQKHNPSKAPDPFAKLQIKPALVSHSTPETKSSLDDDGPAPPDTVIVGGGPMGLVYAWGMKKLNPTLRIRVFEQYNEYQRNHTLIMKPARLHELMVATGTENDPKLSELLADLKKDPHIRTNKIESIFKKVALENNVEIITQKITKRNIGDKVLGNKTLKPPRLVIGADGTHSTVDRVLYPKGNQIKHEFDFVLQLRYEIEGEHKATAINPIDFVQSMARQGLIANEYVGAYDQDKKKTPVTTQMMIGRDAFKKLKEATSKKPIALFSSKKKSSSMDDEKKGPCQVLRLEEDPKLSDLKPDTIAVVLDDEELTVFWLEEGKIQEKSLPKSAVLEIVEMLPGSDKISEDLILFEKIIAKYSVWKEQELTMDDLPENLQSFINNYLIEKATAAGLDGSKLERKSIKVSVNEAPATHAQNIVYQQDTTSLLLVGDAALGLSYFKGLNAGLEAAAHFFQRMAPAIKSGLTQEALIRPLSDHQTWFLQHFAPKKVKEVEGYSTWRIRSFMNAIKIASFAKESSMPDPRSKQESIINAYFDLLEKDPRELRQWSWKLYPHRDYDPVKLGQWAPVPIIHSIKRTGKLFIDYFKPYKSKKQFYQDLRQPLVGLNNMGIGLLKLIVGFFTVDASQFGDGFFSLLRGAIEIGTFPLAWTVKPLLRGALTALLGRPIIEMGRGIKKIAADGLRFLRKKKATEFTDQEKYNLFARCDDIHRKFTKGTDREQPSKIALAEHDAFENVRGTIDYEHAVKYFSLFSGNHPKKAPDEKAEDLRSSIAPRYLVPDQKSKEVLLSVVHSKKHPDKGNVCLIAEGRDENGKIWARRYEFTKDSAQGSSTVKIEEFNTVDDYEYGLSMKDLLPENDYYSKSFVLNREQHAEIDLAIRAEKSNPSIYRKEKVGRFEFSYGSTVEGFEGITPLQWIKKISKGFFTNLPDSIETFKSKADQVQITEECTRLVKYGNL